MKLLKSPEMWVCVVCLALLVGLGVYVARSFASQELEGWDRHVKRVQAQATTNGNPGAHDHASPSKSEVILLKATDNDSLQRQLTMDQRLDRASLEWLLGNPSRPHRQLSGKSLWSPQTRYLFASRNQDKDGNGDASQEQVLAYTIQEIPNLRSIHRPLALGLLCAAFLTILWIITWPADKASQKSFPCPHFLIWGSLASLLLWTASTILCHPPLPPGIMPRQLGWLNAGYALSILLVFWLVECAYRNATTEVSQKAEDYEQSTIEFSSFQKSIRDLHEQLKVTVEGMLKQCQDVEGRCKSTNLGMEAAADNLKDSLANLQTEIQEQVQIALENNSKESTKTSKMAADKLFRALDEQISKHLETLLKEKVTRAEEDLKTAGRQHREELHTYFKALLKEAYSSGTPRPLSTTSRAPVPSPDQPGGSEDRRAQEIQRIHDIARDSRYPLCRQLRKRSEEMLRLLLPDPGTAPNGNYWHRKMQERAQRDPIPGMEPPLLTLNELQNHLRLPAVSLDVARWQDWARVRPTDPAEEWRGLAEFCLACLQGSEDWKEMRSSPEKFEDLWHDLESLGIVVQFLPPGQPRPENTRDWQVYGTNSSGGNLVVAECQIPCIRIQEPDGTLRTYVKGQVSCREDPNEPTRQTTPTRVETATEGLDSWFQPGNTVNVEPGPVDTAPDGMERWFHLARESVRFWRTGTEAVMTILQYSRRGNAQDAVQQIQEWYPWTDNARQVHDMCKHNGILDRLTDMKTDFAALTESEERLFYDVQLRSSEPSLLEESDWKGLAEKIAACYNNSANRLEPDDAEETLQRLGKKGVRVNVDHRGLATEVALSMSPQAGSYQTVTWRR